MMTRRLDKDASVATSDMDLFGMREHECYPVMAVEASGVVHGMNAKAATAFLKNRPIVPPLALKTLLDPNDARSVRDVLQDRQWDTWFCREILVRGCHVDGTRKPYKGFLLAFPGDDKITMFMVPASTAGASMAFRRFVKEQFLNRVYLGNERISSITRERPTASWNGNTDGTGNPDLEKLFTLIKTKLQQLATEIERIPAVASILPGQGGRRP